MQVHALKGGLQILSLDVMKMETLSRSSVAEWMMALTPVTVCTQGMEAWCPTRWGLGLGGENMPQTVKQEVSGYL